MLFRLTTMQMTIFVSVPVAGMCATIYYIYTKNRDKTKKKDNEEKPKKVKPVMTEIEVPRELVPEIVGVNGDKMKGIESESRATINLRKEGTKSGTRTCQIMGTLESCKLAEKMILEIQSKHKILETETITVPKDEYKNLIADESKFIESICEQSSAMVDITENDERDSEVEFINIVGTKHQVALAKRLILQMLRRFKIDKNLRRDKLNQLSNGFHKTNMLAMKVDTKDDQLPKFSRKVDGIGYISSFNGANDIHIQKIQDAVARKELEKEMTTYYSTIGKYQILKSCDMSVGNVVAAQYGDSEIWSRGCITGVREFETDPDEPTICVEFTDYGDGDLKKPSELRYLEKEFLSLPTLAVRCALKHPRSRDWPTISFEDFHKIVPVAEEYEVTLKCVGKKHNTTTGVTVPLVKIIDHQSPNKPDISKVLEKRLYG